MEAKDPLNVIVTGVGGQGNVLIAQFIGRALVERFRALGKGPLKCLGGQTLRSPTSASGLSLIAARAKVPAVRVRRRG